MPRGFGKTSPGIKLHEADRHGEPTYHSQDLPMSEQLSPAEAKAYWDQLGEEGRGKYKSVNALIDPNLADREKKIKKAPRKPRQPKSPPGSPVVGQKGANPIAPDPSTLPFDRRIDKAPDYLSMPPDEFEHFLNTSTPARGFGSSGRIGKGAQKAQKFENLYHIDSNNKVPAFVLKNYEKSNKEGHESEKAYDQANGTNIGSKYDFPVEDAQNKCKAECLANDIMRNVFKLNAPYSREVKCEDVNPFATNAISRGSHGEDGAGVASSWIDSEGYITRLSKTSVLKHPDLGKIFAASMFSGDFDTIGPGGSNVIVTKDPGNPRKTRLVPIDNGGFGFSAFKTDGRVERVNWEGDPTEKPDGSDGGDVPIIRLDSTRNGGMPYYGYYGNSFLDVMSGLSDDAVSSGLDCLDNLSDEMIDKMVADSNFVNYTCDEQGNPAEYKTGERIAKTMKRRRDILKEVNSWYKKKKASGQPAQFFDIGPGTYHKKINSSVSTGFMSGILTFIDPSVMCMIMSLARKGVNQAEIHGRLSTETDVPSFNDKHQEWLKGHILEIKPESVEKFVAFMR
jgi:hypothetical protein